MVDSDWIVDYLGGVVEARNVLDALVPQGIGTSIISCIEIEEGVLGSRDPETDRLSFDGFLGIAETIFVDQNIASRTARLRVDLRRAGRSVNHRAFDLIIAATAIEHGIPLVTRNTRDYVDIPALNLYAPA
ncbi:MAG: type II toxin-antitoxin system VapC family toxin [Thermomicrobiales bacterium]